MKLFESYMKFKEISVIVLTVIHITIIIVVGKGIIFRFLFKSPDTDTSLIDSSMSIIHHIYHLPKLLKILLFSRLYKANERAFEN